MDAQTTTTLQCTACGALAQASCNCNAPYVPPAEYTMRRKAKAAELFHQGLTQEQIAARLSVAQSTVAEYLRDIYREPINVDRGKDTLGRKKSPGRPKGKKSRASPGRGRKGDGKITPAQEAIIGKAVLDEGKTYEQGAREAGLTTDPKHHGDLNLRFAVAREQGRREAYEDPPITPDMLPKSTRERFDAAIRQYKRKLDAEFEQRVQAETKKRTDQAFPMLDKLQREAADQERTYKELTDKTKKLGTLSEWNNLILVLHRDTRRTASDVKFDAAFEWTLERKFKITGVK